MGHLESTESIEAAEAAIAALCMALEVAGYSVMFREGPWQECCVVAGAELWLGRGVSPRAALEHALRQMFPSRLAWELWSAVADDALAGAASESDAEAAEAAEAAAGESGELVALDEPVDLAGPAGPAGPAAPALPPESDDDEVPFVAPRVLHRPESAAGPSTPPVAALAPVPTPPVLAPPVDPHALLDALTEEIDLAMDQDFGCVSPEIMRLQIGMWAASARDVQDRHPEQAVVKRVSGIFGRLTSDSSTYWPGTVLVLLGEARPSMLMRDLGLSTEPRSWGEVAEIFAARLADPAAGLDTYGWADADRLEPGPLCPSSRMGEVRAALDDILGPSLPITKAQKSAYGARAATLGPEALAKLYMAAQVLRWLRGRVAPADWGLAMGRLRAAQILSKGHVSPAALDPRHRPDRPWAQMLRSPSVRPPAASKGTAALLEWVRDAVTGVDAKDVVGRLTEAHLTLLRAPMDALVAAAPWWNARSLRKRISALVAAAETTPPAPARATVDLPAPDPDAEALRESEPREPDVIAQARALLSGRSAIFVSNREDPPLRDALERQLGLALTWHVIGEGLRQTQAMAEQVRAKRYSLVILATGFMSHMHERVLRDAGRGVGVPCLRAAKGRVLAVAMAALRDLNP